MTTLDYSRRRESKAIFALAIPIIANGMLESSYGFTNTFMVAKLGAQTLAINGLITMLFITLMVIFWGIISATSIIISHQHGAKNIAGIRSILRDGLKLCLLLSPPIMLLLWYAPDIFILLGQPPAIVKIGERYLHTLTWAVPSDLFGFLFMQFFSGISKPRITFTFTLLYTPLLIALNYIFIFGKLGFPALGLTGVGWGVLITYSLVLSAQIIFIIANKNYRHFLNFSLASKQSYLGELLRVGLPLGGMYCIEIGYFFMLAFFMGKISDVTLAANQIVMQYFWVAMNVVFSYGQALSIRIGWRLGRQEPGWVKPITQIGLTTIIIYHIIIAVIYLLFSHYFIIFDLGENVDPYLYQLAIQLFLLAAITQLIEGPRIACFSILRGLKDTRFTMISSIITFWGVALPLGYYLAFHLLKNNPAGLWLGMIISTFCGCIILGYRIKLKHLNKKGA